MASETAKLVAALTLKDGFTAPLKNANAALNKFDSQITKTQSRGLKAGQQIGVGIKRSALLAVGAIGSLAGLLVLSAKEGQAAQDVQIKFNTAVANSGKVSAAYVKALNDQALALSNLSGQDDEAIRSTQTLLVTMGLTGDQITKLTPLILDASIRTGKDLNTITLAVGRAVQGNATSLGRLGIILPKTTAATKSAALASLEHQKAQLAINKSLEESHGPLTKAEKAMYAEKKAALDAAIGQQKLADATKTGAKAASGFDTVYGALNSRFKGTAAALSGQLDTRLAVLKERLQDVREEAGIKVLPSLTRIVDVVGSKLVPAFGKFIDGILPPAIAGLDKLASFLEGGGATSAIDSFLNTAKTVAPIIQRSAEATGAVIKTAVDLFRSLPPEIQSLALAGLAINKLTGGLVTNIAGGLISAVISSFKGLMNVNAAVVNVNGPVAGIPGPAAEAAGAVGGLSLATLGLVAAAAVASTWAFLQTHNGPGSTGAFTPTLGAAFDQKPVDASSLFAGVDWKKVSDELASGSEGASQLRNAAHGLDVTAQDNAEAASQLRNAARGLDGASSTLKKSTHENSISATEADRRARGLTGPHKESVSVAPRLKFLAGGASDVKDVAVARALTLGFEHNKQQAFHSTAALKQSIRALQNDQKTLGPKAAAKVGGFIDRMKAELARRQAATTTAVKAQKAPTVIVPVSVKQYINGRLIDASTGRFASTIVGHKGTFQEFG
jgi:hypothetical protein